MTYPGGKLGAGTFQRIINQIPPHRTYVEPFVGGGAILLKKRPANKSVAFDLDPGALAALEDKVPEHTRLVLGNGIDLLQNQRFESDTFVYADPPYLQTAVLTPLRYSHVLSAGDHRELLKAVKQLRCPVMLSGYWSQMYAEELADWRTIRFPSMTRGGFACEEWLWMNYPEPNELHDYRYLGHNFRQREKLRRQQKRWQAKLAKMDRLQRLALMEVLKEVVSCQFSVVRKDKSNEYRQLTTEN